eukprot:gene25419-28731_t
MNLRIKPAAVATAMLLAVAPLAHNANAATTATTATAAGAASSAASQAQKRLLALADEYYDAVARFDPMNATASGNNRYDDQIGLTISPQRRERQFALYRQYAKRLQAIPRAKLGREDRISYDILDFELKALLSLAPFPDHLLPLEQMSSMPVMLANLASGEGPQPIGTVKEYQAYLSRLPKRRTVLLTGPRPGSFRMIEFHQVNKWYGEYQALSDINETVARGEIVVVCGPSGSGKSTLIRCINRLEEHQQGPLTVDGIELTDDIKAIDQVRKNVGMVFQQFNLFPHLTVLENLTLSPMWVGK